jgi:cytoskeletal protein RodZ
MSAQKINREIYMNNPVMSLDPTIRRLIAQGFYIEHGQKLTAEYIEQMTMDNAKYYVTIAREAYAERGESADDAAAAANAKWYNKLRYASRKAKIITASSIAAVIAIVLVSSALFGGDSVKQATTSTPTAVKRAVQDSSLSDTTSDASQVNSDTTPASDTPAATPAATPTPAASAVNGTSAAAHAAQVAAAQTATDAAAKQQADADAAAAQKAIDDAAAKAAADELASHVGNGTEPCTVQITSACTPVTDGGE